MIIQGLVALIQSSLAGSPPVQTCPGGFQSQLPKDLVGSTVGGSVVTMAWVLKQLASTPTYILEGQDGFTQLRIRIDCHGQTAANADGLAFAIDSVLRGAWNGTLPDADRTVVQGIYREHEFGDGYASDSRTFVHTLEYLVNYNQR